jgi:hypothetical protein
MAKDYHPDLHPGDSGMERRIKLINRAHDVLADPGQRALYDRRREEIARLASRPADPVATRPAPAAPTWVDPDPTQPFYDSTPAPPPPAKRGRFHIAILSPRDIPVWVGWNLRWRLLPWLLRGRIGQWITVLSVGALAAYLADNLPSLGWNPILAFLVAFVVSGLAVAAAARSFWHSPLGDVFWNFFNFFFGGHSE